MTTMRLLAMAMVIVLVMGICNAQQYEQNRTKRNTGYGCFGSIMNDYVRQLIVSAHNEFRQSLATGQEPNSCGLMPASSSIYQMVYDCDLEESAGHWVAKGKYAYSPTSVNRGAGENIDLQMTSETDKPLLFTQTLQKWWGSLVANGQMDPGNQFNDVSIGNWAQMAYGANTAVGCAIAKTTYNSYPAQFIVCHYKYNARITNSIIYQPAESACRMDTDCNLQLSSTCHQQSGLCFAPAPPSPPYTNDECPGNLMNDYSRQVVVNWHNNLRSRAIQGLEQNGPIGKGMMTPTGMNVMKMEYDCALEQSASQWANKCLFKHSQNPNVGENIYYTTSSNMINSGLMSELASKAWWSEVYEHGISDPITNRYSSTNDSKISHFAQMAWGNTYKIGCASVVCENGRFGMVICQYSPPGDMAPGYQIYELGQPCAIDADCAQASVPGSTCSSNEGLCVAPSQVVAANL